MIVTCENCNARFRLADDKVGLKGAKVRCSKCQHTFTAYRRETPEPPKADAGLTADRAGPSADEPTSAPPVPLPRDARSREWRPGMPAGRPPTATGDDDEPTAPAQPPTPRPLSGPDSDDEFDPHEAETGVGPGPNGLDTAAGSLMRSIRISSGTSETPDFGEITVEMSAKAAMEILERSKANGVSGTGADIADQPTDISDNRPFELAELGDDFDGLTAPGVELARLTDSKDEHDGATAPGVDLAELIGSRGGLNGLADLEDDFDAATIPGVDLARLGDSDDEHDRVTVPGVDLAELGDSNDEHDLTAPGVELARFGDSENGFPGLTDSGNGHAGLEIDEEGAGAFPLPTETDGLPNLAMKDLFGEEKTGRPAGKDPFAAAESGREPSGVEIDASGSLADELFSDLPAPGRGAREPFGGIAEVVSPPGPQRRPGSISSLAVDRFTVARRNDKSARAFALINYAVTACVVAVWGLGVAYFVTGGQLTGQAYPPVVDALGTKVNGVNFVSMRSLTYPTRSGHDVLVIFGAAKNNSGAEHRDLYVKAELKNGRRVVTSAQAPVGVELGPLEIDGLSDAKSIERAFIAKAAAGPDRAIPAGGAITFTVVLPNPPREMRNITQALTLIQGTPLALPAPDGVPEPEVVSDDDSLDDKLGKGKRKKKKRKKKKRRKADE